MHTHSPFATAYVERRGLPCLGTTHADHFHGPVPVTRQLGGANAEIERDYEERTGVVIVETLEGPPYRDTLDVPAVLVRVARGHL